MKLSVQDQKAQYLRAFRARIGVGLSRSMAKRIWGDTLSSDLFRSLDGGVEDSIIVKKKLRKAEELFHSVSSLKFLKYVGVSGSVAAGNALKEDDIDLFIVVRDYTSWIVRAYLKYKLSSNSVRYGEKDRSDKLCINFIVEERALAFDSHDIFILNEIYSLRHLLYPEYFENIPANNTWLKEKFKALISEATPYWTKRYRVTSIPLFVINLFFFLPQLTYMYVFRHNPDFERIMRGFKRGWIKFYPKEFRDEKLRNFEWK